MDLQKRKNIRLIGYDYSQNGAYFITICTNNKHHLFGIITSSDFQSNAVPVDFQSNAVPIDSQANTMPADSHENSLRAGSCLNPVVAGFHAGEIEPTTIKLTSIGKEVEKSINFINQQDNNASIIQYVIMPNHIHLIIMLESGRHGSLSLANVVGRFKSFLNKKYNDLNNSKNMVLWQRNYYEHIIRDEDDFMKISQYIEENPAKWQDDCYF